MNAMAFDVMIPLREALEQVSRDNDVRAVVLTGAGGAFCSGADLENPGRVPDVDGLTLPTIALRSMQLLDDVIVTVRRMHQPVIAAVNGPAIGGGFCLALACDIRLAGPAASFPAARIVHGPTAPGPRPHLPPPRAHRPAPPPPAPSAGHAPPRSC